MSEIGLVSPVLNFEWNKGSSDLDSPRVHSYSLYSCDKRKICSIFFVSWTLREVHWIGIGRYQLLFCKLIVETGWSVIKELFFPGHILAKNHRGEIFLWPFTQNGFIYLTKITRWSQQPMKKVGVIQDGAHWPSSAREWVSTQWWFEIDFNNLISVTIGPHTEPLCC